MPSPGAGSNSSEPRDVVPFDFQEIYDEFHLKIRRYLRRLVGTSEAEDLTQEVFAKVSQALPHFRGDSKVSTWVYRIATNTAFDRLRSPSFQRTGQVSCDGQTPTAEESTGIEQELVRREMNDCIRRYVERLPPSYRSVVVLSEDEGFTNQEIAEALGISLDAVKIRLHRARGVLKRELGSGCNLYRDGRNELACEPKVESVSPATDPRL
jgi:RNA polymerase sigma-70 factor (ECF subfamily)